MALPFPLSFWIPACAGMTIPGVGMAIPGVGMTEFPLSLQAQRGIFPPSLA